MKTNKMFFLVTCVMTLSHVACGQATAADAEAAAGWTPLALNLFCYYDSSQRFTSLALPSPSRRVAGLALDGVGGAPVGLWRSFVRLWRRARGIRLAVRFDGRRRRWLHRTAWGDKLRRYGWRSDGTFQYPERKMPRGSDRALQWPLYGLQQRGQGFLRGADRHLQLLLSRVADPNRHHKCRRPMRLVLPDRLGLFA